MTTLKLTNNLKISNAPDYLASVIQHRLTFANPKYLENENMGRWNGETTEYLKFYEVFDNGGIIMLVLIKQTKSGCK